MSKQNHTILVVDDEPINLRLLAKVLEPHYRTLRAESGSEALGILEQETVSLLITDENMPAMSGTELLRRARTIRPKMVCMIVSAVDDDETFLDAITKFGAVGVINKPWNPDSLLRDVRTSLDIYEQSLKGR